MILFPHLKNLYNRANSWDLLSTRRLLYISDLITIALHLSGVLFEIEGFELLSNKPI